MDIKKWLAGEGSCERPGLQGREVRGDWASRRQLGVTGPAEEGSFR